MKHSLSIFSCHKRARVIDRYMEGKSMVDLVFLLPRRYKLCNYRILGTVFCTSMLGTRRSKASKQCLGEIAVEDLETKIVCLGASGFSVESQS